MAHVARSSSSRLLVPGDVLAGRYRILGPIGNGGLAWVWEAMDLRSSTAVALKKFKERPEVPLARLARREARLLASVSHPGIPRLYGRGTAGGVPYLVLELVRGWNLQEVYEHRVGPLEAEATSAAAVARRLRLPSRQELGPRIGMVAATRIAPTRWPQPGRFILRLAAIVATLHEQGLVHRDINLQNVMTRKGPDGWEPVVVDLGLGCWSRKDTARWGCHLAGNLRTLAPEQIERRSIGCDPRTDVYQLGLVIYRLLTGVDAFAGIDLLVERILAGDFPSPRELDPSVDERLESLCLRALERDPSRRPASARQVFDAIGAALGVSGSRAEACAPGAERAAARPLAARPRG